MSTETSQRPFSDELLSDIRAAISNSYYGARDAGRTMEDAADSAVKRIRPILASVDENAHRRGASELRARVEALADEWQASGDRLIERNRNRKSPAAERRWVEGYSLCRSAVALRAALSDDCEGCLCAAEHDGDYGSSGHPGPCPPHTCTKAAE